MFLVPVLFTRSNERLPDGMPNSLLLEWTEEKGVFRRIGTTRLGNRCDLRRIIPELYEALNKDHEDEDDDADTDGEAIPEDEETLVAYPPRGEPSPVDEMRIEILRRYSSDEMRRKLSAVQNGIQQKIASRATGNEQMRHWATAAEKGFTLMRQAVLSQVPREPGEKLHFDFGKTEEIQRSISETVRRQTGSKVHIEFTSRRTMWTRKHVHKLEPKAAVETQYYLGYADDDSASRYGHFIFELC
ncbi:hypothetical protein BDV59DRAFT_199843 [Aspergillus ambiguus]|uniref:uncharacterized protein n=1 Tax=Aspergillus ambiguus TaxID=176160 RepID=UPI003CCCC27B